MTTQMPGEMVAVPAYVTSEFAAGLADIETESPFSAGVPLPAAVPARFEEATPVLLAQVAPELGGSLLVSFGVAPGHDVEALADFPYGTWVAFYVNPIGPDTVDQLASSDTPRVTVGDLVLVQGSDSAGCGPVEEDGYDTTVYMTVVGELLLAVQVTPVPGCEVSPLSVEDVAELFADLVVCQGFASTPTCRPLVDR